MKILIAGGGKVGGVLIDKLTDEGHEVTLIDINPDVLESIMEQYDIIAVNGNAASIDTLEQAGVADAELLIAATDADEVNLLACITAHGMNPNLHTIGRIRDPEYRAQALRMRDLFGLNLVINPEQETAREIARLLKYPGFLNIETFAKGNVEIVSLRVKKDSQLYNIPLKNLDKIVNCKVLICAVERDGKCIIPDGTFVLKENDLIYVTATAENLSLLLKNLNIIAHKVKNVLIAGGGRISYYLAKELDKTGIHVSIIESNTERCSLLAAELPNATIIEGDASSQNFLDSEGFDDFDAMVTLTGLDELNIVMSLYANARNIPQIITKLSHAENNQMLDTLPIGSVISPKELSCNSIIRYVRAMQNTKGAAITIHMIADGQGEAIEFIIDENTLHVGEPLKNIKTKKDVLIVGITNETSTEIASGDSRYHVGDNVVIVTNGAEPIYDFNDIFES